ncbi:MAG: leucine--tRNA ligase [Chloroflexi bacterium]|nr:MAG: leucine--tRNA ligase [Chloroflexota bacterium]
MAERYEPKKIEPKWQKAWEEQGLYRTPDVSDKDNHYFLTMYPYPSGDLHIGHWYVMAPSDAGARFKRMSGYNVLFPMGFDAFGLPAENAAIKRGIHPRTWTMSNIENMRRQMRSMGPMFDWSREVVTCDPSYYKWNQWIFLKFFEKGLAYRALAPANWCPKDETVLANEQVINGRCERCDTPVVKKDLVQWFFKITAYADELLRFEGIEWPEPIQLAQRNWIGRSEGARLRFPIEGQPDASIEFFTTRPDTIFGATFMVLAPEHPLVERITAPAKRHEVSKYVDAARNRTDIERLSLEREKIGVFTGAYATNLFTGERIPIWIAEYVLMGYGSGAIMAVPAHDERDFAFAKKHGLPIRQVISPDGTEQELDEAYAGEGVMVNSGPFEGTPSVEAKRKIAELAKQKGWGDAAVSYRLRDWLISRQRYWGTPIPIVHCPTCGLVGVPESELPVLLPEDVDFQPHGESPLARHSGFMNTTCPRCQGPAKRDPDTMDAFVDSSWYMWRYPNPRYERGFADPEANRHWSPVDQYTGGTEHAVMHLLYARFFTKALRDLGYLWFGEPFVRLFNQGQIVLRGRRMSKSRGNVEAPDTYVEQYGADSFRLFLMFIGPWEEGADWDAAGIEGTFKFLKRLWTLVLAHSSAPAHDGPPIEELERLRHRSIKRVTEAMERFRWNIAVAALMEYLRDIQAAKGSEQSISYDRALRSLLLLLAPMAPHISEELWQRLGATRSIHLESWPTYDPAAVAEREVTVVIQVNGKVRDRVIVPAGSSDAELTRLARENPRVKASLDGARVSRVVVVRDRLVNVVTGKG